MRASKIVWAVLCALSAERALATDVNITIDGVAAAANPYLLQSLQLGASGVVDLKVTTAAGATYPKTFTLTLSPTINGSIVLPDDSVPAASYVCTAIDTCTPAATVTLKAKPAAGYKLQSWGAGCLGTPATSACLVSMTSNQTVSAVFEAEATTPPSAGVACNPAGSTLVDVATPLPVKQFPRTDYPNTMTPTTIYAFAFKTSDTTAVSTGVLAASQLSNTIDNKWIVISECRGDIDRSNKDVGCARYAPESTTVTYVLNKGAYKPTLYCNLKPNTQYYANVVAPGKITGLAQDSCVSTANCGFSFLAQ